MPRTDQSYEEARDKASRRILESARRVFARKGMGGTVADIAEEAGVSQGLAYRYFPSKEAIFHTLMRQLLESEVDWSPGDQGMTPRERLEHLVSETMRRRREHPDFYRFVFQAISQQKLPRDIRAGLDVRGQKIRELMRRLVIEAQAQGEVSKDEPDQLVDVIIACLEGLSMRLAYPDPKSEARIPDTRVILRILGPDPSKRRGEV